jgi:2-C-methyl-D-erythritol 4-phosphate cytidylyltransferase
VAANYALIPAAGSGSRIGAGQAKQYRLIAGRPMICHAIETFAACERISRIFVVVSADDSEFDVLPLSQSARLRCEPLRVGGASRHASVENGLNALAGRVDETDWMLVHDAARPGLSVSLLEHLLKTLENDPVGGLLALPLADTLKRQASDAAGTERVAATVERSGLWQAQTPQMFRHKTLLAALQKARLQNATVTDEASAIEQSGQMPRLVTGSMRNFKVTYPDDMILANQLLRPTE